MNVGRDDEVGRDTGSTVGRVVGCPPPPRRPGTGRQGSRCRRSLAGSALGGAPCGAGTGPSQSSGRSELVPIKSLYHGLVSCPCTAKSCSAEQSGQRLLMLLFSPRAGLSASGRQPSAHGRLYVAPDQGRLGPAALQSGYGQVYGPEQARSCARRQGHISSMCSGLSRSSRHTWQYAALQLGRSHYRQAGVG